ncbi:MAG: sulfotransferase, partial [Verrucomicrobiae bacterium]|nr:sulfotransferase [Verrucomicrobiae bacterium]
MEATIQTATGKSIDFSTYYEQHRNDPVVIILGCQGSGTNLLSKMLINLFDFAVIRDRTLIFNSAINVLNAPTPATVRREDARIMRQLFPSPLRARFTMGHYHHRNRGYVGLADHLERLTPESAEEFAYRYYLYHAWRDNARHIALKCDDMWETIGHLDRVFSRARFIQLVRDPRDNALSVMRKNFGPRDIYAASRYIKTRINAYDRTIKAHPGDAIQITYETVLNDPHRFVDLFRDTFGYQPVTDVDAAIEALKIRSGNQQKWRRLSAHDLRVSETVLKDELEQFGYEIATPDISPLPASTIARHVFRDKFFRIPQKLGY